jgi:hypothetical protein
MMAALSPHTPSPLLYTLTVEAAWTPLHHQSDRCLILEQGRDR